MPSYAIAQLSDVRMGEEIAAYLAGIDESLAPFGGRFLVHGGQLTRAEGDWPAGDLIIISFPDRSALERWYSSAEYQAILPLRTDNSTGDVIFVDGVSDTHKAADVLQGQAGHEPADT